MKSIFRLARRALVICVIDAVAWPGPRTLLQGLWIVAALVVLAAALDMLRVRGLPRRAFGPWGRAVVQL